MAWKYRNWPSACCQLSRSEIHDVHVGIGITHSGPSKTNAPYLFDNS